MSTVRVDDGGGRHGLQQGGPGGWRQSPVDRENGVTVVPHLAQRVHEGRSGRQVDCHETGHGE
jgi:hypothetical protein